MFGKRQDHAPFDSLACKRIEAAIERAEKQTSGEIHVHVASHSREDVRESAVMAFETLGMAETKQRNGVLLFFATEDRKFAVIGDKGINDIVGQGFWDDVVSVISKGFAAGTPIDAICEAIDLCGTKLRDNFPPDEKDDDELPNEVSFSK